MPQQDISRKNQGFKFQYSTGVKNTTEFNFVIHEQRYCKWQLAEKFQILKQNNVIKQKKKPSSKIIIHKYANDSTKFNENVNHFSLFLKNFVEFYFLLITKLLFLIILSLMHVMSETTIK